MSKQTMIFFAFLLLGVSSFSDETRFQINGFLADNQEENHLISKDSSFEEVEQGLSFSSERRSLETTTPTTTLTKAVQIQAYLDSETCTVFNILAWVYAGIIVLAVLNTFAGVSIHGIFFLISFAQSSNLLIFINYVFPKGFVCFYQSLGIFSFQKFLNLPSWIRGWFSDEGYISQEPSEIFDAYGLTANWFDMGGKALTPLILLCLVWVIARLLRLLRLGTEAFPILMKKIEETIVWNGMIRMMQILYMPLLLSCLLQFQNISFSTTTNVLGFLFTIFTCVLLIVFIALSIVVGRSTELKDKGYQERYGAVYLDYWLDKEIDYFTANFEMFMIVKKSIQVVGVIILGVLPSLQIAFFVGTECVHTILLFTKRRLKDKTNNKLANIMSTIHFLNTLVLCGIFLIGKDGQGDGGGWLMVILSAALFLMNLLLVLAEQLVSFGEIFRFYGEFLYGIWLLFFAFFSCIFCPCFFGYRFYWQRKSKNQETFDKSSELALM